ncbi:MAG: ABC transporter permease subunit [Clostridiales bacterium]|nr:ABC transporter permease subunit [Clostridiales bacterium]
MTKCLKSDFYRLFRGRALYIYLGLILVLSILTAVMNVPKFELSEAVMDGETITVQSWEAFSYYGEIVYKDKPSGEQLREKKSVIMLESFEKIAGYAAIYTFLFIIISEFLSEKNKTMKNKVAVGVSRFGIYVSKFIFSLAVYIFTYVIHALATAAVIMSRKEDILVKAVYLQDAVFSLAVFGLLMVSVIVLIIGIFYCIGPYACVAIALGFIVAAVGLSNIATTKLDEPQYIETYNEEGVVLSREDNPAYVSGIERSIYKGIIDYNPVTAFSSERDERSGEYPDDYIYTSNVQIRSAILWFVIYNGISIVCFKKMERL